MMSLKLINIENIDFQTISTSCPWLRHLVVVFHDSPLNLHTFSNLRSLRLSSDRSETVSVLLPLQSIESLTHFDFENLYSAYNALDLALFVNLTVLRVVSLSESLCDQNNCEGFHLTEFRVEIDWNRLNMKVLPTKVVEMIAAPSLKTVKLFRMSWTLKDQEIQLQLINAIASNLNNFLYLKFSSDPFPIGFSSDFTALFNLVKLKSLIWRVTAPSGFPFPPLDFECDKYIYKAIKRVFEHTNNKPTIIVKGVEWTSI